jgi:hypothetical protein
VTTKKTVTVAWRTTYTGGLAIPVAFKYAPPYVEYVKPAEKTETRGAMHGVWTYADADIILILEQTGITRRRYVTLYLCKTDKDMCQRLAELAEAVWKTTGNPKLVVAKILETYGRPATQ